jgi:hypothetical protein
MVVAGMVSLGGMHTPLKAQQFNHALSWSFRSQVATAAEGGKDFHQGQPFQWM